MSLKHDTGGKLTPSTTECQVVEGDVFGLPDGIDSERIYSRAIGHCPEATINIGYVECRCLLDSGSEVSMVTKYHSSK